MITEDKGNGTTAVFLQHAFTLEFDRVLNGRNLVAVRLSYNSNPFYDIDLILLAL